MEIKIITQGERICIEEIDTKGNIHISVIADSLMKAINVYDKVRTRKKK